MFSVEHLPVVWGGVPAVAAVLLVLLVVVGVGGVDDAAFTTDGDDDAPRCCIASTLCSLVATTGASSGMDGDAVTCTETCDGDVGVVVVVMTPPPKGEGRRETGVGGGWSVSTGPVLSVAVRLGGVEVCGMCMVGMCMDVCC